MINHWVCLEEEVFGEWQLSLPIKSLETYKAFTKAFLQIGEQSELFIISLDEEVFDKNAVHKLFYDELERISNLTGYYCSINYLNLNKSKESTHFFLGKTAIYCYNQNYECVKLYASDMGYLLREINPKLVKGEDSFDYAAEVNPIMVRLVSNNLEKGLIKIWIQLKSNIFFPKIGAKFLASQSYADDNRLVDNSILAELNASKLNHWLKDLNQLTQKYDGSLKLSNLYDLAAFYSNYLTDEGILF